MDERILQIAERLKGLRDAIDMTPAEVAQKVGISEEQYAKYESGENDIPMSFLYSIAKELNIDMQALISGGDTRDVPYSIVRKGKGVIVKRKSAYTYYSLIGNYKNAKGSPFLVAVKPTAPDTPFSHNTHDSDELDFVMRGSILVSIDGKVEQLNEGDSIYFNARIPHGMKAVGDKRALLLSVAL